METAWAFYRIWFGAALRHAWGGADLINGLLGLLAAIIVHLQPGSAPVMSEFAWRAAVFAFFAILGVRLLLAPYWIWRGQQRQLNDLLDAFAFSLTPTYHIKYLVDPNGVAPEKMELTIELANKAGAAIQYFISEMWAELNGVPISSEIGHRESYIAKDDTGLIHYAAFIGTPVKRSGCCRFGFTLLFGPPGRPYTRKFIRAVRADYSNPATPGAGTARFWNETVEEEAII